MMQTYDWSSRHRGCTWGHCTCVDDFTLYNLSRNAFLDPKLIVFGLDSWTWFWIIKGFIVQLLLANFVYIYILFLIICSYVIPLNLQNSWIIEMTMKKKPFDDWETKIKPFIFNRIQYDFSKFQPNIQTKLKCSLKMRQFFKVQTII